MTQLIIIATCFVSILAFTHNRLFDRWQFNAYKVYQQKEYRRLLGSGFLHGDYMHLAFNMLSLYCFGRNVEVFLSGILEISYCI